MLKWIGTKKTLTSLSSQLIHDMNAISSEMKSLTIQSFYKKFMHHVLLNMARKPLSKTKELLDV